jgi:hypothetical protein
VIAEIRRRRGCEGKVVGIFEEEAKGFGGPERDRVFCPGVGGRVLRVRAVWGDGSVCEGSALSSSRGEVLEGSKRTLIKIS